MQSDLSQDLQVSNSHIETSAATGSRGQGGGAQNQRKDTKESFRRSNQICRFYNTKKGCRAHDQCPYLHVPKTDLATVASNLTHDVNASDLPQAPPQNTAIASDARTPRVNRIQKDRAPVPKPVPTLQQTNPREFQIGQVKRRFSPLREDQPKYTQLGLKLQPSDPDFPFELDALECTLIVPTNYPKEGRPSLTVENKDIPKGFQINVEKGFASLAAGSGNKTLLQLLNELDRNLERFLTSEKAQTVKIVANRPREESQKSVQLNQEPASAQSLEVPVVTTPSHPQWTAQQIKEAKESRDAQIRQLEARMGRVPLFSSSKDGSTFNVPLQIPKPSRLPLSLQSLKEITLKVPMLYNLEPCHAELKGVYGTEIEHVEKAFEKRAADFKNLTLMAHVNYLTQNVHIMAIDPKPNTTVSPETGLQDTMTEIQTLESSQPTTNVMSEGIVDEDRPHLRFISQPPPEWNRQHATDQESDDETMDEYDSDESSSGISEDLQSQVGGAAIPVAITPITLEKGVLVSFPNLELHGIELLELRDISLSVKCDRCKEALDIKNLRAAEPTSTSIRTESCNKCASPISLSYRPEPMHVNSIKAGHLDLEGCTIFDMLPSHFLPTCSECSTTQPAPGVISVRGESPIAVCRECHQRLNFKIPEVKFLRVSSTDPRLNLPLRSKRKKENLGITAGTELPERGRCKHYAKSYRWFRFSCCNRVYPCDRCHDAKEEHPNEHANRMICGWCSREQNYRPEDCNMCRRSVIRKTGGGFWEGGKGTRDRVKMNRNDPRKHKRIGGGAKGGEK